MKEVLRVLEYRMKRPVICLTEIPEGHYRETIGEAIYEEIEEEYSRTDEIYEYTDTGWMHSIISSMINKKKSTPRCLEGK